MNTLKQSRKDNEFILQIAIAQAAANYFILFPGDFLLSVVAAGLSALVLRTALAVYREMVR